MKNSKKIRAEQFAVVVVLFLFAVFICMQSELAPFSNGISGTDSSVFRYVAKAMSEGQLPYKDTFDHKGPLIYFINYIGMLIHENRGIWCIGLAFVFVGMLFSYRTVRMFNSRGLALLSVITVYALYGKCYKGGNMTEEYAATFAAVSLFYFIKYLETGKVKKFEILICGSCFAAVCMLRVNMIAVWIVFVPVLMAKMICYKRWDDLKNSVIYFLVGCMAVIVPICMYLLLNHIFMDFYYAYILFNIKYTGNHTLKELLLSCQYFIDQPVVYIAVGGLIYIGYLLWKKQEEINVFTYAGTVLAAVVSFVLICMAGRQSIHYTMILVPSLLLPVTFFYRSVNGRAERNLSSTAFFIDFCIITVVVWPLLVNIWQVNLEKNIYITPKWKEQQLSDVQAAVDAHCDEDDTISVFGNKDAIYLICNRMSASKYSYQFPVSEVDRNIYEEYLQDLENNPPKLIVINQYRAAYEEEFREWLDENHYHSVDEAETIFLKE